jgi:hypothetical protein
LNSEEVTKQILGAWDEIVAADESPETGEPQPEPEPQEAPAVEPEPDEPDEGEPDEDAGEDEGPDDGEEPDADEDEEPEAEPGADTEDLPAFPTEDLEIKAFLAKFQGDPEKALRYGLQSQQALSKLGHDKDALQRRVEALEGELQNVRAFNGAPQVLSGEQRAWVEEAAASAQPAAYVQEAIKAGEYDLARAVCREWGDAEPYDALRAAQVVEAYEQQAAAAENAQPTFEPLNAETAGLVLDEIARFYPDIREHQGGMAQVMAQLGDGHQLVVDARSGDPDRTVPALVQILDIARVSSLELVSTRERARNGSREAESSARRRATVASAEVSPSPSETPRPVRIGPGLTLEQLDEEWARNT